MDDAHIKELLSGYIDDALTEGERRRVDTHNESCSECREELSDIERVSKMVRSLPEHELPGGFMERLRARLRREGASEERPRFWTLIPARSAALVFSSVVVCVLIFRDIKTRMEPTFLPASAMSSAEADSRMQEAFPEDKDKAEFRESSVRAREDAPAESLAGASGSRALLAKKIEAPETLPGKSRIGNEGLRKYLDAQAARMDIKSISKPTNAGPVSTGGKRAPARKSKWDGISDRPMSRAEAQKAMRQMTRNLYEIRQSGDWKKAPTVPLEGRTPKMLEKDNVAPDRGSLMDHAPATAEPTSFSDRSIGFAGANAKRKLAKQKGKRPPSTILISRRRRAAPRKKGRVAAIAVGARTYSASGGVAVRLESEAASDEEESIATTTRTLVWTRDWSDRSGGMGIAGGAVIHTLVDWADMHRRIGFETSLPEVDFSREMVIGIFGDRSSGRTTTTKIISVIEEKGRLLIVYRTRADASAILGGQGSTEATAAYHIIVVPRSDLPFEFIKVP